MHLTSELSERDETFSLLFETEDESGCVWDKLDDSGIPLDADQDEVEEFMQGAWDTFLTTYLAEIERSYNVQNARIVFEDGVWAVDWD
jgi:hypothetical protein